LFLETKTGGLMKVGRKITLYEALRGDKIVVKDGVVRLLVVPKARTTEFIEGFKKRVRGTTLQ
jgi:hypothetical protein